MIGNTFLGLHFSFTGFLVLTLVLQVSSTLTTLALLYSFPQFPILPIDLNHKPRNGTGERQECGSEFQPNQAGRTLTLSLERVRSTFLTGGDLKPDHLFPVLTSRSATFTPRCCLAYPTSLCVFTLILTDSTFLSLARFQHQH